VLITSFQYILATSFQSSFQSSFQLTSSQFVHSQGSGINGPNANIRKLHPKVAEFSRLIEMGVDRKDIMASKGKTQEARDKLFSNKISNATARDAPMDGENNVNRL
jgi:hypothetical protein